MGYQTQYAVRVIQGDCDAIRTALDDDFGLEFYDEAWRGGSKWYDHESDLQALAEEHGAVFCVDGVGEEQPDIWRTYISATRTETQEAVFTLPTFVEFTTEDAARRALGDWP